MNKFYFSSTNSEFHLLVIAEQWSILLNSHLNIFFLEVHDVHVE